MPWQLQVDKLEDDGTIAVTHIFYGEAREDCERERDAHGAGCNAFGPALRAHRVIEEWQEIDSVPEWTDDNADEEGDE